MKLFLLIFLFYHIPWCVQSSKILILAPMPAHSHFTLMFRLAKELAEREHQVTFINPYPQTTPIKNFKDVSVEELVAYIDEYRKELFKMDNLGIIGTAQMIYDMGGGITERTFANTNVQKLLNSDETFDVVIIEHFLTDALLGLGHRFGAPTIVVSPTGVTSMTNYLFANPAPSSYVPDMFGSCTKHMNFLERLQNFLSNVLSDLMKEFLFLPQQRSIFKKYIKTDVELDDVMYNVSLMLANSHVSINDAVPTVSGIVEIGGYHVNPPKKLPEDLQKFLDESNEGVILFSMGSNLKSKDLKPEVRASILKAFSKIKQNVLWKFEADLPEAPKNVKIMKWLPQQDILAHPNIRAFISHGGLLSSIETVYHGVPVIGIPIFGDQKTNIARVVTNGYGLNLPLEELTEDKLLWTLNEIINNPKYRENVKKRSSLMHDRPLKPIDTAIYWIEHVIRHRGAPHLRSAGLDLKWYQRELIDVIGFLVMVVVTSSTLVYFAIKKLFGLFRKKKPTVTKSKKKK